MNDESTRAAPRGWFVHRLLLRLDEDENGDIREWSGLTAGDARQLAQELEPHTNHLVLDGDLTLAQAATIAERLGPAATIWGYRVVPNRPDERVTVRGIHWRDRGTDTIGLHYLRLALTASGCTPPASIEFDVDTGRWTLWWDGG